MDATQEHSPEFEFCFDVATASASATAIDDDDDDVVCENILNNPISMIQNYRNDWR